MNDTAPTQSIISLAILAMGGEGGGVLADWLVDLAEHNGHWAQTTSVPGVAQRTGATIYYIEMYPRSASPSGQMPVMALSPFPPLWFCLCTDKSAPSSRPWRKVWKARSPRRRTRSSPRV